MNEVIMRYSGEGEDLHDLKRVGELVRCKDCKHRPTPTRADEGITYGFSVEFPDEKCPCQCEDGWYNWYPKNDFYCGAGERKEESR